MEEPQDVTVLPDQPAVLGCSVRGQPAPEIRWKKDGILLDFPNPDRQLLANGSLHLQGGDEKPGVYQCMATMQEVGTILSTTATVEPAGWSTHKLLSFKLELRLILSKLISVLILGHNF